MALAHNVRSQHEVDETVEAAQAAGATITKSPETTFYGGYAGAFADPDGHVWEIAYNPGFPLEPGVPARRRRVADRAGLYGDIAGRTGPRTPVSPFWLLHRV